MTFLARPLVFAVIPALGWKVARALGLGGATPVIAGPSLLQRWDRLPFCERYVALQTLRATGPNGIDPIVIDELEAACRRHAIDTIVPADLPTGLLLARAGHRLRRARPIGLSRAPVMERTHDKWLFSQLLADLALPQPRTRLLHGPTDATDLRFPILTKVRDGSNGVGIVRHESPGSLRSWMNSAEAPEPGRCVAQELIAGQDVGVTLLADKGKLVAYAAFVHDERWSRAFFADPELQSALELLVDRVGYHGVAHLDARRGADGRCSFLELNPRFAGSLLYCVRAGVNFAHLSSMLARGQRPTDVVVARAGRVRLPLADRALGAMVTTHGRYAYAMLRRRQARALPAGTPQTVPPAVTPFPQGPDDPIPPGRQAA